jgi:hypothetical protein
MSITSSESTEDVSVGVTVNASARSVACLLPHLHFREEKYSTHNSKAPSGK